MTDDRSPGLTPSATVDVVRDTQDWTVRVSENGSLSITAFAVRKHAEAFASGQRHRLRLTPAPGVQAELR